MTDADFVIAGQLHQSFVCAANTVHKKRYARRTRERDGKREREKKRARGFGVHVVRVGGSVLGECGFERIVVGVGLWRGVLCFVS